MRHYDEDMIDFKVSDSYRDFYALQGLTYPSGRQPRPAPSAAPIRDEDAWQQLGEIVRILKAQQADIDRLKQTSTHPPDAPSNGFEGVE